MHSILLFMLQQIHYFWGFAYHVGKLMPGGHQRLGIRRNKINY